MYETLELSHGRIEHRRIEVVSAGRVVWPGLRQWGRLTRVRIDKKTGKESAEVICFITSFGESQATAVDLLRYLRDHWRIENGSFRTKDTLLQEDASTIRTASAPQALAALRNLTLWLLSRIHPSPTQAREIATDNKNAAIQLIT